MTSKLTLVTALYNIGRGDLSGQFVRPFDQYLMYFEQLLKIDLSMVIFCDYDAYESVATRSLENTAIHFVQKEFLANSYQFDMIQKIRKSESWLSQADWLRGSPQARLEYYNPLVMTKAKFLRIAANMDTFDSEYYLWVDAGIAHMAPVQFLTPPFEENVTKLMGDKFLQPCFPYRSEIEVHGFNSRAFDNYNMIPKEKVARATIFGGPKHRIPWWYAQYVYWMNRTLNDGYMGTEENLLTLMVYNTPQHFVTPMLPDSGNVTPFLASLR